MPSHFEEPRLTVLHALMRAHPLATLITLSANGIDANHVPLLLEPAAGPFGTLRGHIARANPMWTELREDVETLAIFQGPDSYVSPSWYATKAEQGKVVPTWNYAVVHAHGTLRVVDDPAWLRRQLDELTTRHEAAYAEPWALDHAPREFTDRLMAAIVGIELEITRLSGKWKISQNQSTENQEGVVRGMKADGSNAALDMAALMEAFSPS